MSPTAEMIRLSAIPTACVCPTRETLIVGIDDFSYVPLTFGPSPPALNAYAGTF